MPKVPRPWTTVQQDIKRKTDRSEVPRIKTWGVNLGNVARPRYQAASTNLKVHLDNLLGEELNKVVNGRDPNPVRAIERKINELEQKEKNHQLPEATRKHTCRTRYKIAKRDGTLRWHTVQNNLKGREGWPADLRRLLRPGWDEMNEEARRSAWNDVVQPQYQLFLKNKKDTNLLSAEDTAGQVDKIRMASHRASAHRQDSHSDKDDDSDIEDAPGSPDGSYPERSSPPCGSTYATMLPYTGFGPEDPRTGARDVDSDMEDAAGSPDDSYPGSHRYHQHSAYAPTLPHTGFGAQDSRTGAHDTPHVQPDVIPVRQFAPSYFASSGTAKPKAHHHLQLNYSHVPDWRNVPFPSYYAQSVPTIPQNEASAFYPNYPPRHLGPSYISDLAAYPVPHTATTPSNTQFMVNPGRPPPLANPYAPNFSGQQFLPTPIVPNNAPSVFVPHHPSSFMRRNPAQPGRTLDSNYAPHATQAESDLEGGMEDALGSPDSEYLRNVEHAVAHHSHNPRSADTAALNPFPEHSLHKRLVGISERTARRYGTTRMRWMAGRGW